MKRESRMIIIGLFLFACLTFLVVTQGFGEEYEALKGLKSIKAVFDFPGIKHVPNGWVSLIGYEAMGYSLVPAH